MAQGTATSFAVPNFSGMLFAKGQTATPFSTMIGARPLVTNHVEFTCGQEYNTNSRRFLKQHPLLHHSRKW